jgi:hypothetical protein
MSRFSVSKWFVLLSMGLALATDAGCGAGSGVILPTPSEPPPGVTFEAGEFGHPCSGDDYEAAGIGWAFCDDGKWAYTTADPSADGFTDISPYTAPPPVQGGGFGGGFQ